MNVKVLLEKRSQNVEIPKQGREGDFCYDVYATSEKELYPGVWEYGLGFSYEMIIPEDFKEKFGDCHIALSFRPRSSVWKTGMSLSNCIGTLDEFYRGEVKAVFYHVIKDLPRYKTGDKIGQIHLDICPAIDFDIVDSVNKNTVRGEGGFGSTDKKKKDE